MGMGLPLIGLVRERQALANAVTRRESLLLLGPGGSGKTTLVQSVLESQSPGGALVHIPHFETLHDLLVTIARELFRSGHKLLRRKAAAGPDWERWLDRQTSVSV
jgi:alpha-D-ribose 1-methylphosphonate 5-triphosphate synthase subunit PhnL